MKIHVPQLIRHHVHTKTIYIHSPRPKKNKKEHPKRHVYPKTHEKDEITWNSYNHHHLHQHGGYDVTEDEAKFQKNHLIPQLPILINKFNIQNQGEPPIIPFYDDYKENLSSGSIEDFPDDIPPSKLDGVTGYAYPPQYENQQDNSYENNKDKKNKNIPIDDNFKNNFQEENYKNGQIIQSGHVYKNQMKNFYDNTVEDVLENSAGGSSEENYGYGYFTKLLN